MIYGTSYILHISTRIANRRRNMEKSFCHLSAHSQLISSAESINIENHMLLIQAYPND